MPGMSLLRGTKTDTLHSLLVLGLSLHFRGCAGLGECGQQGVGTMRLTLVSDL